MKNLIFAIAIILIIAIMYSVLREAHNFTNWTRCMGGEHPYENLSCQECDSLYNTEGKYMY